MAKIGTLTGAENSLESASMLKSESGNGLRHARRSWQSTACGSQWHNSHQQVNLPRLSRESQDACGLRYASEAEPKANLAV